MVIGVESPICIHALYEDVGSENTRVDLAAQFIRMCSCLGLIVGFNVSILIEDV